MRRIIKFLLWWQDCANAIRRVARRRDLWTEILGPCRASTSRSRGLASLRIAGQATLDAEVLSSLHGAHHQTHDIRFRRRRRSVRRTPTAAVLSRLCDPALLSAFPGSRVKPDW
ncbi:MAG TPA: hypothetical protein VFU73_14795 [Actinocrinis sp.]|nr:hypothetical protein [Actinocrinis sp.]